jgi:hypothetical protein
LRFKSGRNASLAEEGGCTLNRQKTRKTKMMKILILCENCRKLLLPLVESTFKDGQDSRLLSLFKIRPLSESDIAFTPMERLFSCHAEQLQLILPTHHSKKLATLVNGSKINLLMSPLRSEMIKMVDVLEIFFTSPNSNPTIG